MRFAVAGSAWQASRAWDRTPARAAAAAPAFAPKAADPALPLKCAIVFALLSLTLLDRFGLRLSAAYAVGPTLLALYALVAAMLMTRSARLQGGMALMYVAVVSVSGLSYVVNVSLDPRSYASLGSWMLVLVLYAPLALSLAPAIGSAALWRWTMKGYLFLAVACALAGIVQFYAQFVFHAPWLFDFRPWIPNAIRGPDFYNTTNYVGALVKSNGFFLREASGFSAFMAFALVCEMSLQRRRLVMAVLALGLLVSYSGSGLLALAVAMLFPLGQKTLARLLACGVVGAIVVVLFGEALNLTYTLGRIGEFDSTSSSAYCRFIAPAKLVAEQIDSDAWTTLLGHGPGTTQKLSTVCETTYGKLLFEYGLLGAIAFTALIVGAIGRSAAPIRLRVVLLLQWFALGGNLLAPEALLLIFFVSAMWPPGVAQSPARADHPARARLFAPRALPFGPRNPGSP